MTAHAWPKASHDAGEDGSKADASNASKPFCSPAVDEAVPDADGESTTAGDVLIGVAGPASAVVVVGVCPAGDAVGD